MSKEEEVGCRERSDVGVVRRGPGQERFGRLVVRIASGCMHRGGVGRGRRGSRSALTYCSTFVRRAHSSLSEPRGVEEEEEEEGAGGDRGLWRRTRARGRGTNPETQNAAPALSAAATAATAATAAAAVAVTAATPDNPISLSPSVLCSSPRIRSRAPQI